ncbi:MAG: hypothetical protein GY834_16140 [Bacteroidetes bacterium]|nr:hypothetical protein [Bacteroidota bacterium]
MEDSTSREKILKKIRNALINKQENPFQGTEFESSVYTEIQESLDVNFAKEFTEAGGKFVYCESPAELAKNLKFIISENKWKTIFCLDKSIQCTLDNAKIPYKKTEAEFLTAHVGITRCEFLISRLGSIMVSSKQCEGRRLNAFPEIHIVIGFTSQLVADLKDALADIQKRYPKELPSMITVITGPSRTADIEKTLVMGAHGPKELYLFLIDDTINSNLV